MTWPYFKILPPCGIVIGRVRETAVGISARLRPSLLRLDAGGPDHLTPLLGFVGNEFAEFGRCHRRRLNALVLFSMNCIGALRRCSRTFAALVRSCGSAWSSIARVGRHLFGRLVSAARDQVAHLGQSAAGPSRFLGARRSKSREGTPSRRPQAATWR